MNKKEKYINFIVADLVSKTEIDYDQEIIKLPFLTPPFLSFQNLSTYLFSFLIPFSFFSNHVRKVYGAHGEEMGIIWDQYKERIKELIDNE